MFSFKKLVKECKPPDCVTSFSAFDIFSAAASSFISKRWTRCALPASISCGSILPSDLTNSMNRIAVASGLFTYPPELPSSRKMSSTNCTLETIFDATSFSYGILKRTAMFLTSCSSYLSASSSACATCQSTRTMTNRSSAFSFLLRNSVKKLNPGFKSRTSFPFLRIG